MYVINLTLRAPSPEFLVGLDRSLIERALLEAGDGLSGFEHLHVRAGPDHLDIWLFIVAPTGAEAADLAHLICHRGLRDHQPLAGWTGDQQVFTFTAGPPEPNSPE
ncbi:hypothetical protein ACIBF5_18215 [Micromonospora sp. NPDC050417]|uniref:hypothetical protein n=1 Tax=Micromonospora sp. NPDC050417 TaxID=3364280 RepID=UPI0037B97AAB